jgi:hypothetical protein
MGLGLESGSFFQSLTDQGLPRKRVTSFLAVSHHAHISPSFAALFSLFLTPDKVGSAELTLGGTDPSKFSGTPVFAPAGANSHWELTASKISVNGKTSSTLQRSMGIIFDSGTSNLVFPKAITEVSP